MNILQAMKESVGLVKEAECGDAIELLSAAIEEMEKAEPVVWRFKDCDGKARITHIKGFAETWGSEVEPLYLHPAPAIPESWKDHNTAKLVNELRDIAIKYQDMQQLRERIAHVIRPLTRELNSEFERGYDTGFLVGAEKGRTLPIPPGYKLIAREPTEEMMKAAHKKAGVYPSIADQFRAMWDAAPEGKP